jgi:hypothetical protein
MPQEIHCVNVLRHGAEFEQEGDVETAAGLYANSLLSWYPDHELAPQAQEVMDRIVKHGEPTSEEVTTFRAAIERLRDEQYGTAK